jgi:hypothetical protein
MSQESSKSDSTHKPYPIGIHRLAKLPMQSRLYGLSDGASPEHRHEPLPVFRFDEVRRLR